MIRAKFTITHGEKSYKKGAVIEGLTEKEEERLVSLKAAEFVISPEEELKKQKVQTPPPAVSPEKYQEYATALKDLYNLDELKREAKDVGVDLTGITRRDDVIDAIIVQGKAEELVEDEDNLVDPIDNQTPTADQTGDNNVQ